MREMRTDFTVAATRLVIVASVLLACAAVASTLGDSSPGRDGSKIQMPVSPGNMALKELSDGFTRNYRPSLEMRENVDFLLSPAILVQNTISDNVVITYPSE